MRRQIRGCSVTRRKSAAYHTDKTRIFRAGVKDGLSDMETGKSVGRLVVLRRIASVLDVSLDVLGHFVDRVAVGET